MTQESLVSSLSCIIFLSCMSCVMFLSCVISTKAFILLPPPILLPYSLPLSLSLARARTRALSLRVYRHMYARVHTRIHACIHTFVGVSGDKGHTGVCNCRDCPFLDGYCSTVQGLLDWFEVDLKFTELVQLQRLPTHKRDTDMTWWLCVASRTSVCLL